MAAAIQVEAVLLGEVIPFLPELTGDERVDAQGGQFRDGAVAAAAAKGHSTRPVRAVLHGDDTRVVAGQGGAKFGTVAGISGGPRHGFASGRREEGPVGDETELAGEEAVVAQLARIAAENRA